MNRTWNDARPAWPLVLLISYSACQQEAQSSASATEAPVLETKHLDIPYDWVFGKRRRSRQEVRVELEQLSSRFRSESGEWAGELLAKLEGVVFPYPRIVVKFWGVPVGEVGAQDIRLTLSSDDEAGFTLIELITKINNRTIEQLKYTSHVYLQAFMLLGSDPKTGLPLVEMSCGS